MLLLGQHMASETLTYLADEEIDEVIWSIIFLHEMATEQKNQVLEELRQLLHGVAEPEDCRKPRPAA